MPSHRISRPALISVLSDQRGIDIVGLRCRRGGSQTSAFRRADHMGAPVTIYARRAARYGVARSVTTSARPSTSAYVAKRNAPYFPPDVACSFGINVPRFESTAASPIIPGIARSNIAEAQSAGTMCRQRSMAIQIAAEASGEMKKLTQYRKGVVSKTRGPVYA